MGTAVGADGPTVVVARTVVLGCALAAVVDWPGPTLWQHDDDLDRTAGVGAHRSPALRARPVRAIERLRRQAAVTPQTTGH